MSGAQHGGGAAAAIGRSLDIYYRDRVRAQRMQALNARFVGAGDLAFDLGAHVGDRTASFLALGARVVALEPQPDVFRALRLIHGRTPGVRLRQEAVGATAGEMVLHINGANPTVSTGSQDFIASAKEAKGWQAQVWDGAVQVPVTTLDQLIKAHGVPDFIKLDVEGFEAHALQGLSVPVPALSFEFTTIQRDVATACLARLASLGAYRFNLSLGEDHVLQLDDWITGQDMRVHLCHLPDSANSGDVYARLG